MPTYIHFQTLLERVQSHPDTPLFKLPHPAAPGQQWQDISYTQFNADIERMARYWGSVFAKDNIPIRSVIGIWLRGFTYTDVVTIYSISRAGFIPQMFGFELPNHRIVYELLTRYDGRAIIHDPAKTSMLVNAHLPCHVATPYTAITSADVAHLPLWDLPQDVDEEDFTFIYHTSGSVSGMPKVVPKTNRWLSTIQHKSGMAFCFGEYDTQDIFLWTESFSHSMEICLFQLIFHRAGCLVQPTRIDFGSPELSAMVRHAGVNRIIQFTNVLRAHLEDAREERVAGLLGDLKKARQITYAGMPLATELEDWAVAQGLPITNNFGCTECGQLLTSVPGDRRLIMLPNIHYRFIPVGPTNIDGTEYAKLVELEVVAGSPDLPVKVLCSPGGGWRSGDLFEEPEPGKYIFRGRDDDWINSMWSERLDTKSIEDNIYTTCTDIVANCVVVGNGRPFPALFVEPRDGSVFTKNDNGAAIAGLKAEIIKRTAEFHSMRYLHERIQDSRMIKIVPAKTLPRTAAKGNIRRRAVEQDFAADLEAMYASIPIEEVFAGVLAAEYGETEGGAAAGTSETGVEATLKTLSVGDGVKTTVGEKIKKAAAHANGKVNGVAVNGNGNGVVVNGNGVVAKGNGVVTNGNSTGTNGVNGHSGTTNGVVPHTNGVEKVSTNGTTTTTTKSSSNLNGSVEVPVVVAA